MIFSFFYFKILSTTKITEVKKQKKNMLLFLHLISLMKFSHALSLNKKCVLPNGCALEKNIFSMNLLSYQNLNIYCNNPNSKYDLAMFNRSGLNCDLRKTQKQNALNLQQGALHLAINPSDYKKETILHRHLNLLNLLEYSGDFWFFNYVRFINFKGIRLETQLEISHSKYHFLEFYNTDLYFYDQKQRVIKNCDDLDEKSGLSCFLSKKNLGNAKYRFTLNIDFKQVYFKTPICETVFINCTFVQISFSNIFNTYIKSNILKITNSSYNAAWNTEITTLAIDGYNIHLTRSILNPNVFKNVNIMKLKNIFSIQTEIFRPFNQLRRIFFIYEDFEKLVRRQGIDWIKSINWDVNVNASNFIRDYKKFANRKVDLRILKIDEVREENFELVKDADFCLYKNFPFNQLVVFYPPETIKTIKITCSFIWLYFNNSFYSRTFDIYLKQTLFIPTCNFEEMSKRCQKSKLNLIDTSKELKIKTYQSADFMILSEFLLIIFLSPLISIFGIITNFLVIFVIRSKANRKELKERQYTYIMLHSLFNISICLIQILSLVNECQLPIGLFCSNIRHFKAVQYFKIVVGEFFDKFFRLMSNFTYVSFSLSRLQLIGTNQNQNQLTKKDFSIKVYVFVLILICTTLSLIKAFRYQVINFYPDQTHPVIYNKFYRNLLFELWNGPVFNKQMRIYKLIYIFDFIYDLVNYVLFALVNLVIDGILMVKMRMVLNERIVKLEKLNHQQAEKLQTESGEILRRMLKMIFLNSFVNFLFKLPITITTLNDLRLFISMYVYAASGQLNTNEDPFRLPLSFKNHCASRIICEISLRCVHILFILALSSNLFFLKAFDKKFMACYDITFAKKGKNNTSTNNKKL